VRAGLKLSLEDHLPDLRENFFVQTAGIFADAGFERLHANLGVGQQGPF
jgi:hypothetical protein